MVRFLRSGLIVVFGFGIGGAACADVSAGIEALEAGNVSEAATAFAEAYDAGEGEGAFYLGRLFELGLGTEQDESRAANLYAAAAEKGSVKAKLRLGMIYHEGRVLLRDYVEGTKLICEAAEAGDAEGELNCGLAYQQGKGVAQDAAKARTYFEAAAAQDNVAAMNVLAQQSSEAGDREAALSWSQKAADAGNALGMYRLAQFLSEGETPQLTDAYAYASLAYVRGLVDAGQLRDALEARMSPEDVIAGQAQAKAWTEAQIAKLQE
nr:tetratricopeptide repeat protein [uncultured Celeribacter sp.]